MSCMVGVKSGINTWNTCYGPLILNLIVLGDIHLIPVHGCGSQGLDDKELLAYRKVDREPTEVKKVLNKLRGAWKINCENTKEGRRQQ